MITRPSATSTSSRVVPAATPPSGGATACTGSRCSAALLPIARCAFGWWLRVHSGGAYRLSRTCARSSASQMRARPSRRHRRAPPCVQRRLGLPGAHSFTVCTNAWRRAPCRRAQCAACTRLGGSTLADCGAAALVLDARRAHRLMCVAVSDSSPRCLSAVPRTRWGGQIRALPRLTAVRL